MNEGFLFKKKMKECSTYRLQEVLDNVPLINQYYERIVLVVLLVCTCTGIGTLFYNDNACRFMIYNTSNKKLDYAFNNIVLTPSSVSIIAEKPCLKLTSSTCKPILPPAKAPTKVPIARNGVTRIFIFFAL